MWITSMDNHGAAGGISERRRSSCSSFLYFLLSFIFNVLHIMNCSKSSSSSHHHHLIIIIITIRHFLWNCKETSWYPLKLNTKCTLKDVYAIHMWKLNSSLIYEPVSVFHKTIITGFGPDELCHQPTRITEFIGASKSISWNQCANEMEQLLSSLFQVMF